MLAGNTAISSSIISQAPMVLVAAGISSSANAISHTPLIFTSISGYGSQGGIMRV